MLKEIKKFYWKRFEKSHFLKKLSEILHGKVKEMFLSVKKTTTTKKTKQTKQNKTGGKLVSKKNKVKQKKK